MGDIYTAHSAQNFPCGEDAGGQTVGDLGPEFSEGFGMKEEKKKKSGKPFPSPLDIKKGQGTDSPWIEFSLQTSEQRNNPLKKSNECVNHKCKMQENQLTVLIPKMFYASGGRE